MRADIEGPIATGYFGGDVAVLGVFSGRVCRNISRYLR